MIDHSLKAANTTTLPVREIAGVVLLRDDDSALLQLRDQKPGLNAAGLWVFPGGHRDAGESLEAAARREFLEETGYKCGKLEWVTTFSHPGDDGQVLYRMDIFVTRYDGVQSITCFEGQAVAFIRRDQISEYPAPPYIRDLWDLAIEAQRRIG